MANGTRLSGPEIRKVAVAADTDPRTVARRLRGEMVRPSTGARIDKALRELGFAA